MTVSRAAANGNSLAVKLLAVALAMFGFGYAMIPVYDALCAVTGINGKTGNAADAEVAYAVDDSREIVMEFIASVDKANSLSFQAETPRLKVHPGEYRTVSFQGENKTAGNLVIRTMPSVSPGMTAEYLKKTACFCFTEQTLKPGESRKFSVRFAISPELPARYKVMTLALSIFDITEKTVTQNSK